MINEITKTAFEKAFPEVSDYGLAQQSPVYLENGTILIDHEWNGEKYIVKEDGREVEYTPMYSEPGENGDFEIIGYERH